MSVSPDILTLDTIVAIDSGTDSLGIAPGALLDLTGNVAVAGSLAIEGPTTGATLLIDAAASLTAGGVSLAPGGALADSGSLGIDGLDALGAALLPGGAALAPPLAVEAGGIVDFAGLLRAGIAAPNTSVTATILDAGALIRGAGTLVAGNFGESAIIAGPCTIIALGPIVPLYGVFDATPVTIGGDATISFAPGANSAQQDTGYASARGEWGGVLVIEDPLLFAGTLANFSPGDMLVFPALTALSVFNIGPRSFEIPGIDPAGPSEVMTIHASLATGIAPVAEADLAGPVATCVGRRCTPWPSAAR